MPAPPARTLIVPRRAATPRGFVPSPLPLRWPDKEPGAIQDYSFDASNLFATGAVLAWLGVAIIPSLPGGVAVDASSIEGIVANAILSGGVAGVDYEVVLTLGVNGGPLIPVRVKLLVNSLTVI